MACFSNVQGMSPISVTQTYVTQLSGDHSTHLGWLHGRVIERRSVTCELGLPYARPAADGSPLMWVK